METRKKILIKVTNNKFVSSSAGEIVTLKCFIEMLNLHYDVRFYGNDFYHHDLNSYQFHHKFKNNFKKKYIRKIAGIFLTLINSIVIVKEFKPDLIMCIGGVYYNGLCVLFFGKLFGVPSLVRTAEDHYRVAKLQEQIINKFKHYFIIRPISHFVLKNSVYSMTVGQQSARYLSKILKRQVLYAPSPIMLRNKNKSISQRSIKFLYVGTLDKMKGSYELDRFVRGALRDRLDWNFVFVGTDKTPSKIMTKLKKDFGNRVSINEAVENSKLSEFYSKSEFLIFTTKVGIGYGLVTLEASAHGCEILTIKPRLDIKKIHKSYTVCSAIKRAKLKPSNRKKFIFDGKKVELAHIKLFESILS